MADEAPNIILSGPLLEDIFRVLAARPYSEVAMVISKLQTEIQQQQKPAAKSTSHQDAPVKKP